MSVFTEQHQTTKPRHELLQPRHHDDCTEPSCPLQCCSLCTAPLQPVHLTATAHSLYHYSLFTALLQPVLRTTKGVITSVVTARSHATQQQTHSTTAPAALRRSSKALCRGPTNLENGFPPSTCIKPPRDYFVLHIISIISISLNLIILPMFLNTVYP